MTRSRKRVVKGYKKIEDGVVEGFTKMTDKFVDQFVTRERKSVEEVKARIAGEKPQKAKKAFTRSALMDEFWGMESNSGLRQSRAFRCQSSQFDCGHGFDVVVGDGDADPVRQRRGSPFPSPDDRLDRIWSMRDGFDHGHVYDRSFHA